MSKFLINIRDENCKNEKLSETYELRIKCASKLTCMYDSSKILLEISSLQLSQLIPGNAQKNGKRSQ